MDGREVFVAKDAAGAAARPRGHGRAARLCRPDRHDDRDLPRRHGRRPGDLEARPDRDARASASRSRSRRSATSSAARAPTPSRLKKDGGTVDAITAATISSRAVANGVREALAWYRENFPQGLGGGARWLEQKSARQVFLAGIVEENPILVLMIGLCPLLAVSSNANDALGMGVAASFVLVASNLLVSLLRKADPGLGAHPDLHRDHRDLRHADRPADARLPAGALQEPRRLRAADRRQLHHPRARRGLRVPQRGAALGPRRPRDGPRLHDRDHDPRRRSARSSATARSRSSTPNCSTSARASRRRWSSSCRRGASSRSAS